MAAGLLQQRIVRLQVRCGKKMKNDFAPGLPDKEKTHTISQKGISRLVIQEHNATNKHYDIRLYYL